MQDSSVVFPSQFFPKKFLIFFLKKLALKKILVFYRKSIFSFQATELFHISRNVQSELKHIQNTRHIQNTVKYHDGTVLQIQLPNALFCLSLKNKKIYLKKNSSAYFQKLNFLALILKYSYILSKESFTYISGNRNLQEPAQAQKKKEKSTPGKISYTSGNENPRKTVLYLLKIKLFLYFRKRKLERETLEKDLIFQEVTCKA